MSLQSFFCCRLPSLTRSNTDLLPPKFEPRLQETSPAAEVVPGAICSCIGACRNGKVKIFASDQENHNVLCYVVDAKITHLFGDAVARNPPEPVFDTKRLLTGQWYFKANLPPSSVIRDHFFKEQLQTQYHRRLQR